MTNYESPSRENSTKLSRVLKQFVADERASSTGLAMAVGCAVIGIAALTGCLPV